jgi:cell division protein FtsL
VKRLLALRPKVLALTIGTLWCMALLSAAGAIYLKHRSRELFVELERANARRDNLEIEWSQLQLEQSAWSTHAFVERIAGARLRMQTPPPQEIQVVSQPLPGRP